MENLSKKTVITITGIRPDFIRMSEIFKKLDVSFNHILIHTGQHFDKLLSDVFFEELDIRKPDYNLEIGGIGKEHFHQSAELSVKIIELIRNKNLNPDLIIFLGDSNSVTSAIPLKKEGYKIAHIEAGMRSYDKRMLEEINRIVCDHCSDFLFVYHENYKERVMKENINPKNIFVVGNTIVEVAKKMKFEYQSKRNQIILDIHRPENFKHKNRMIKIFEFAQQMSNNYKLKIKMIGFKRTIDYMNEFGIDPSLYNIEVVGLMSFKTYIESVYNSKFIISDSGTAQEEPSIFNTPVLVPRDYTERPESVENNCSFMIPIENLTNDVILNINKWLIDIFNGNKKIETDWLGNGTTSDKIIEILKSSL